MKEWRVIHRIKKELEDGGSVSEVARRLGIDRKTVRKYRDGSEKEIVQRRRRARRRTRKMGKFMAWLKGRVAEYEEHGVVNCECLYRELLAMGYKGSQRTVRRCVARMRSKTKKRIYQPFETPMGGQAMVDMSEFRRIPVKDGTGTLYFLGMVLCCSRKKYGEWYDRPVSTEMFLMFHQRAFKALGGVPVQMVYDQTKLAVLQERYGECQFNGDFYAFARFCGFEPYICNKYDPETKGKIEAVMRYVKRGFLPGRSFADMRDIQMQWEDWLENVADRKPHETTGKPPREFWREEKEHLQPLPQVPYQPEPSREKRKVLTNGLVKVLGNAYSVPHRYHGGKVRVRITDEKIEFYDVNGSHICSHWRGVGRGKRFTDPSHYHRQYSVLTEVLERKALSIYQHPGMLEALKARFPRHYREQLRGLIRLERDTGEEVLREAAGRAVAFGCVGLGNIEKIIRGVEANKRSLPLVAAGGGKTLSRGRASGRNMSYYVQAVQERQEEQDE